MKNLSLKIWSLLIAMAIAFFVNNQSNTSVITLLVPVEVQNLPAEKMILLPTLSQAQVTVRGPSFILSSIASSPPTFKLRFPEGVEDCHRMTLQASDLALPPSIELLSIEPSEVEFILDDRIRKMVNVLVTRIGAVNNNLKLESIKTNPQQVQLIGAKTELEGVDTVATFPLDLRGITKDDQFELGLQVPGKYTKVSEDNVQVSVFLRSVQTERKYSDLEVEIRTKQAGDFTVSPSTVHIEISGPKRIVENLKSEAIIPYVRVRNGASPGAKLEVKVDLPNSLSLVFVDPLKVTLQERKASKQGK